MAVSGETELTDLELAVLGIVWKKAPCTGYAVMREFAASPSSHFRGSAGAIYPLVRRLSEWGHLKPSAGMQGRRPRVTYVISRKGLTGLSWDEVFGVMKRAVARGQARKQAQPLRQMGVDEKAFRLDLLGRPGVFSHDGTEDPLEHALGGHEAVGGLCGRLEAEPLHKTARFTNDQCAVGNRS